MGAGKTAVGRRVASRLALPFVDADREIEARTGLGIPEIFSTKGELWFRRTEETTIREILEGEPPGVLALGGGALESARTRSLLARQGLGGVAARRRRRGLGAGEGLGPAAGRGPRPLRAPGRGPRAGLPRGGRPGRRRRRAAPTRWPPASPRGPAGAPGRGPADARGRRPARRAAGRPRPRGRRSGITATRSTWAPACWTASARSGPSGRGGDARAAGQRPGRGPAGGAGDGGPRGGRPARHPGAGAGRRAVQEPG